MKAIKKAVKCKNGHVAPAMTVSVAQPDTSPGLDRNYCMACVIAVLDKYVGASDLIEMPLEAPYILQAPKVDE